MLTAMLIFWWRAIAWPGRWCKKRLHRPRTRHFEVSAPTVKLKGLGFELMDLANSRNDLVLGFPDVGTPPISSGTELGYDEAKLDSEVVLFSFGFEKSNLCCPSPIITAGALAVIGPSLAGGPKGTGQREAPAARGRRWLRCWQRPHPSRLLVLSVPGTTGKNCRRWYPNKMIQTDPADNL